MDEYDNAFARGQAPLNRARNASPQTGQTTALDAILARLSHHQMTISRLAATVTEFNARVQGPVPRPSDAKNGAPQPVTGVERIAAVLAEIDADRAVLEAEIDRLGAIA